MNLKFFCFEPFGVNKLFNRNIGKEVMEKIIDDLGYVDNTILPVNDFCKQIVSNFCNGEISKDLIIVFGEHISPGAKIRIEPYANSFKQKIYSPIAEVALKFYPSLVDHSRDIGDYYCNDVYRILLESGANCLFIHCGPEYQKDYKLLLHLISKLKRWSEKESLLN